MMYQCAHCGHDTDPTYDGEGVAHTGHYTDPEYPDLCNGCADCRAVAEYRDDGKERR